MRAATTAALRQSLAVGTDEIDRIGHGEDLFGGIVGDFHAEFFFEGHHQLDGVEAVGAQIVDESRLFRNLFRVGVQVLDYDLANPFENIGAQLAKEIASKTNDIAGDGTTTATVLGQAIVHEGMKNVAAGADPMALKRGIEAGAKAIKEAVTKNAVKVTTREQMSQVASISAASKEIGDLIGEVMEQAGKDRLSSSIWSKALEQGDPLATQLIGEGVDAIAAAAANVINILDVEAIILGGGLGTRFGQPMADRIGSAMKPYLFQPDKAPPVVTAALGDKGGAIGATLLVGAKR